MRGGNRATAHLPAGTRAVSRKEAAGKKFVKRADPRRAHGCPDRHHGRHGRDGHTSGRPDRSHPLDQRGSELRRGLRVPHRRHPAEHRGTRARRPARPAQGRGPLAPHRLRVRPRPGRRQLRPGHRRRPHRPPLVHGPVRTGRHRLHQGHRPQRPDQPPAHHDQAGDVPGVDDPAVVQRHRTQPGPHLLPGVRGRRRPSLRRAGDGGGPRRTHPDLGAVRRPRRVDRRRIHRGRTRSLAVPDTVANACSFLGLDPLYVANEGKLVAFVPPTTPTPSWRRCAPTRSARSRYGSGPASRTTPAWSWPPPASAEPGWWTCPSVSNCRGSADTAPGRGREPDAVSNNPPWKVRLA
ncbi:protein of unknown function [Streptomyces sp. KY75]|nr:protein of unknown function [Streptomyces sp. KY75]